MSTRRIYHQDPRDDFVIDRRRGLATVRTDNPDGTSTFGVLVAAPGLRGLHLDTGTTVTRVGPAFIVDAPGPHTTHPTLTAALTVAARRLPPTTTAFAA